MDWAEFEGRRLSGFNTVRRGYDQNEVDRFLNAVADWLQADAPHELGDWEVERKIEAAGQSTARILLIAEQEAQELWRTTETKCAELRAEAQAAANESAARILEIAEQEAEALRRTADQECTARGAAAEAAANDTRSRAEKDATTVRAKADEDAKQMIDEARKRAREAAREETERQRAKIDAMIVELERRRDAAVGEVERLRANLLSAISQFAPRASSTEPDGGTGGRRHAPAYGPSKHAKA